MTIQAVCKQGVLAGTREGGALAFYDIPYGAHAGRFRPAGAPERWEGVRDAAKPGPVFPQVRSRLGSVLGTLREEAPQREDAFRLNIWTPDLEASLPVFFYIHGGGFATGAGSLPWYNGADLAATGRAVAVTVNYRLGALGHLHLPGVSEGNLAFGDLLSAFQWVRENIAGFGGDPERITIAGQSAGAWYAAAMMASREMAGQARQFCLLSFPGTYRPAAADAARELAEELCRQLGAGPDGAGLLTADVDKLLEAQILAEKEMKRAGNKAASFGPVADGVRIQDDIVGEAVQQARFMGYKVLLGTTRDETAFFYHTRPMEDDEYLALIRRTSREMFIAPTHRFAALLSNAGADAYVFQFNRASRHPRVLACHCIELPFLFGNFHRYENAPMLEGMDMDAARGLSRKLQGCLLHFLEHGSPGAVESPSGALRWPRYDSQTRQMMIWDAEPEVAEYREEDAE